MMTGEEGSIDPYPTPNELWEARYYQHNAIAIMGKSKTIRGTFTNFQPHLYLEKLEA